MGFIKQNIIFFKLIILLFKRKIAGYKSHFEQIIFMGGKLGRKTHTGNLVYILYFH